MHLLLKFYWSNQTRGGGRDDAQSKNTIRGSSSVKIRVLFLKNGPVTQQAEVADLKFVQFGFESRGGYHKGANSKF